MTETNIAYTTIVGGLIVGLVILLFKNKLTTDRDRQRDSKARQHDFDSAASAFDFIVNKWLDAIGDKQKVLSTVHSESIPEIEPVMLRVHAYLDDAAKGTCDELWKNYKSIESYRFKGVPTRIAETGNTRISLDDVRKIMSETLEKMKEIIHDT